MLLALSTEYVFCQNIRLTRWALIVFWLMFSVRWIWQSCWVFNFMLFFLFSTCKNVFTLGSNAWSKHPFPHYVSSHFDIYIYFHITLDECFLNLDINTKFAKFPGRIWTFKLICFCQLQYFTHVFVVKPKTLGSYFANFSHMPLFKRIYRPGALLIGWLGCCLVSRSLFSCLQSVILSERHHNTCFIHEDYQSQVTFT